MTSIPPDRARSSRALVSAAARAARTGTGHDEILRALREAWLWIEVTAQQDGAATVTTVEVYGLPWLPVRTTTPADTDAGCWVGMTGAELLAELIPQLPARVGLVLDPGTEHSVALPAITEAPITEEDA